MERWSGKVAVVTGASSGIGAAIVKELVKHNIQVLGVARRVENVEQIKQELGASLGKNLHPVKGNVSKPEDIQRVFQWVKEKFTTCHILVNAAGIITDSSLAEGPYEDWKNTIDTNVLGLCACTQEALQLMKSAGVDDGHIVHINSICGHNVTTPAGFPVKVNVYAASKYAVTALTETLRLELNFAKSKTKVTSVSPGLVNTNLFNANNHFLAPGIMQLAPSLLPKDVADSIIYILGTPPHVQIHELVIKPVNEPF